MEEKIPTAKLRIIDPSNWEQEMRSFAAGLIKEGRRPRFEVRWPAPESLSPEERAQFEADQENELDVIELIDNEFVAVEGDTL